MSVITVVATLVVREDAVDAVKAELLKMIAPTRQEEGCIEYRLHQDTSDPSVFLFFETWAGQAALERHKNSPHYRNYVAAVDGMLADKSVRLMTAIG